MEYQKIWDKVLNPNEQVKYEFSISKRYRKFGSTFFVILGAVLILLGIFAATGVWVFGLILILVGSGYYGFYLKVANAYAFTDRRVLVHIGWLSTKMISTEYQKITDVTIIEPFLSHILVHTGTLKIDTAGTSKEEIVLKNIERPYEVKKKLDELRGRR